MWYFILKSFEVSKAEFFIINFKNNFFLFLNNNFLKLNDIKAKEKLPIDS